MEQDDYSEFWQAMNDAGVEVSSDDTVLQVPNEHMGHVGAGVDWHDHVVDHYDDDWMHMRSGNKYSYVSGESINGMPVYAATNGGVEVHGSIESYAMNSSELTPEHQLEEIEQHPLSPESPKTRQGAGWHALAPRKGSERNELKAKCGDACFLRPEDNGFPICAALDRTEAPCAIDCRGLAAAKSRSRTLAPERKANIEVLQEHYGCASKRK